MKKLCFLLLLIAFVIIDSVHANNSVIECSLKEKTVKPLTDSLLNQIIHLGKTTSVVRHQVDWNSIEPKMRIIYQKEGLIEATKYMLKELNDYHGRIWVDRVPHNGVIKPWVNSKMDIDDELFKQYQQGTLPIYGTTIKNHYGYIRIPSLMSGAQDPVNAKKIRQAIIDAEANHEVKGWIVDLRLNGGGTMFPMLVGLSDFFESGKEVGSFIDKNTDYKESWIIKNNEFYFDNHQLTDYNLSSMEADPDLEASPVVVLTSSATTSSGEVVTIAFKQRPNTFFIGEDTGGYTTTASSNYLADNIMLQLTVSYYADRHENVYSGDPVKPDEYFNGGDNFSNLDNDLKIQRAIQWINNLND